VHSRRTDLLIGLGLVAATAATYAPVLNNDFISYDDRPYITENAHVQAGLSWDSVCWAFTTTQVGNWHPLTWLSFQLDSQLYGPKPWGFHLTNVLLHSASTLVLFLVLRRLTGEVWPGAFVAACFALHPLHVQSVAWAAERKDVLSTLLLLLTLAAYAHYAEQPRWTRYLLVVLTFTLGLMAKSMLVTVPFVLLLLDYWPLGRLWPSAPKEGDARPLWMLIGEKLPLLLLAAVSTALTLYAQARERPGASGGPWGIRLGNAVVAYTQYLGMTLWPRGLAVFYPYPERGQPAWKVAGAALLLAAITALVLRQVRRRPYLAVGWLWYLGTLVPVIGVVRILGGHGIADRYTYVPLIGVFLMVGWAGAELAARWPSTGPGLAVLSAMLLAACALATRIEVGYWRDSRTLWTRALEVTHHNFMAEGHLGLVLFEQGDMARSARHFAAAVRLQPDYAEGYYNLGVALVRMGELDRAEKPLQEAIRLDPQYADAHYTLGLIYQHQGKVDEAQAQLEEALRLEPSSPDAHNNLGVLLLPRGRTAEALAHFREAVRLDPNYAPAHNNLGVVLTRQSKLSEAIAQLREAVRLRPGEAAYHVYLASALHEAGQEAAAAAEYDAALRLDRHWPAAFVEAARVLATDPDAKKRDGPLALQLARAVCQATKESPPEAFDVLAAAYAELGRFDQAAAAMRRALELSASRAPDQVRQRRQWLRRLERRQPLRMGEAGP
jgi:Tfp pilus assembly protein PilF